MPIIICVTGGAGAVIRLFGPEHMGGIGDIGARIDAEVVRTGLSDEEIGSKVNILFFPHYHLCRRLQCMITKFFLRRYVYRIFLSFTIKINLRMCYI